jgi:nicotinate-nucleotide adenylyltransferase
MKLGVFGGSFDPVHLGHLVLAESAREALGLEQVLFIPARISPLKSQQPSAAPRERLEMLRLAVAGHAQFKVSDLELQRQGPSYTVDTLRQLAQDRQGDELVLLIGADSLTDLPAWSEPQEILRLARVAAVNRGRTPPVLPPDLLRLAPGAHERIQLVSMPAIDISATDLRQRVATGRSIRFLTPRAVELFIQQHRLYLA